MLLLLSCYHLFRVSKSQIISVLCINLMAAFHSVHQVLPGPAWLSATSSLMFAGLAHSALHIGLSLFLSTSDTFTSLLGALTPTALGLTSSSSRATPRCHLPHRPALIIFYNVTYPYALSWSCSSCSNSSHGVQNSSTSTVRHARQH